jgi:hypothetical protein
MRCPTEPSCPAAASALSAACIFARGGAHVGVHHARVGVLPAVEFIAELMPTAEFIAERRWASAPWQ